jgi:hypothetical protein
MTDLILYTIAFLLLLRIFQASIHWHGIKHYLDSMGTMLGDYLEKLTQDPGQANTDDAQYYLDRK